MRRTFKSLSVVAGLGALIAAAQAQAAPPDWTSVPGKEVVLFYPGQASWEWALTQADMSGAKEFRQGKNCDACHVGEEKKMGEQIVTGTTREFKTDKKLEIEPPPTGDTYTKPSIEPTPIAGKPGWIAATVKFANDGTNLYVHLDFKEGNQPDAKQDPKHATMVTVMFNDGKVPEANRGGCFAACHDDATGMPSAGGAERTMYLPKTRAKITRQGGGDTLAAPDQLASLKSGGYFLEYWQARLNPGQPAEAANGLIFDKREQTSPTVVSADATNAGGTWSVTLSRKIDAGPTFKRLDTGTPIFVGFAIHSGHTAHRFHYISYERTLLLTAGTADFVAVKP